MTSSETIFTTAIGAAGVAVAHIPDQLTTVKELDDDTLLASQRELSELKRIIDARSSLVAGEIAFRSRKGLGYTGLAQKQGFQSAEKLVQATTGSSRRDASTLVTAGALVHESMMLGAADPVTGEIPEGFVVREPWLAAAGAAVSDGSLTVDGARAIRSGLGEPGDGDSTVTVEALMAAVDTLLDAAGGFEQGERNADDPSSANTRGHGLNADELYRRARELRDELDEAGIAEREKVLYSRRSLRRSTRPNGVSRYTLDPDLEMAAWLDDVYDKLTSPRRGGPRFVDAGDREWSEDIATDTRTIEQYLHDAFLGLLHKGVDADLAEARDAEARDAENRDAENRDAENCDVESHDVEAVSAEAPTADSSASHSRGRSADHSPGLPGRSAGRRVPRIVGSRVPAVRVLVTEESLRTRTGHGRIEGSGVSVSIETVERLVCASGTIPIQFGSEGNVLDLGRESRLFTTRQKVALSARDGGCMFGRCDRPASWTEAHHINHWVRDAGKTDLADGILLCRHHHMLVHNNHWEIVRKGSTYWLIPPPDIDPAQKPRELVSKSAALRDLRRQRSEREREPERERAFV